jgi:porin
MGGKIWRLTQAWVKKGFADNTVQFKVGRMGMSDDFNSSQCEFQNLLLCGGQLGKSIGSIWYNLPVGVWGTNVKYQFAPEWTFGVGAYEVNPDNVKTGSKVMVLIGYGQCQGCNHSWNWHGNQNLQHLMVYQVNIK